jgi:hypothetical protein
MVKIIHKDAQTSTYDPLKEIWRETAYKSTHKDRTKSFKNAKKSNSRIEKEIELNPPGAKDLAQD